MKANLALALHPLNDSTLRLAKQMGVTDIVTGIPPSAGKPIWDILTLLRIKSAVEDLGLKLSVMEGAPPMEKAKLGLPGRDEEIENFCLSVQNMGTAGIPIICYNYMEGFGWMRTSIAMITPWTRFHEAPASIDL